MNPTKLSYDQLKTLRRDSERETKVHYYHGPEYYARFGAPREYQHDRRWSLSPDEREAFCTRRTGK